jgi:hypothetical protein
MNFFLSHFQGESIFAPWILRQWIFKLPFCVNVEPHILHGNGRSLVWTLKCLFKSHFQWKFLKQYWQSYPENDLCLVVWKKYENIVGTRRISIQWFWELFVNSEAILYDILDSKFCYILFIIFNSKVLFWLYF